MEYECLSIEAISLKDEQVAVFLSISKKNKVAVYSGITCIEQFLNEKTNHNTTYYLYNLNFDGNLILNYYLNNFNINVNEFNKKSFITEKSSYVIHLDVLNITLKCIFKLCDLKLTKIGEFLNIKNDLKEVNKELFNMFSKKKFYKEYLNIVLQNNLYFSFLEFNCKYNLDIIKKLLEYLINFFKLHPIFFKNSISSFTFYFFLENKNKNVLTYLKNEDEIFRDAFFGGRVEIFGNPIEGVIQHFDYKKMYTNIMLGVFPVKQFVFKKNPEKIKIGFYYIVADSCLEIPIFPTRVDGEVVYPNGTIEGLYWCEEIQLFLENNGKIIRIDYGIEWSEVNNVFSGFLNYFDNKASEYSKLDEKIKKNYVNSLFGRLGIQKNNNKMFLYEVNTNSEYNYSFDTLTDEIFIESNVAYAAIIASKARILLYKSILSVIKAGGRLLYIDTDSIVAEFPQKTDKTDLFVYDFSKKDTFLDEFTAIKNKFYLYKCNNEIYIKSKGFKIPKEFYKKILEKFYKNENIQIDFIEFCYSKKNSIYKKKVSKIIDLQGYNKRIFNVFKTNTTTIIIK